MSRAERITCDGIGCDESHPVKHDCLNEPCFAIGRWLGWVYLDLNRPDLFPRALRFCSIRCLEWWLDTRTQLLREQSAVAS